MYLTIHDCNGWVFRGRHLHPSAEPRGEIEARRKLFFLPFPVQVLPLPSQAPSQLRADPATGRPARSEERGPGVSHPTVPQPLPGSAGPFGQLPPLASKPAAPLWCTGLPERQKLSLNILRWLIDIFLSSYCFQSEKNKGDFLPFLATVWEGGGDRAPPIYSLLTFFQFFCKEAKHAVPWGSSMKSENTRQKTEHSVYIWLMYEGLIRFCAR